MRLSEAIRLGAMLHPQGFGVYRDYLYDALGQGTLVTCALAAAEDAGFDVDVLASVVSDGVLECPSCARRYRQYGRLIVHLNDKHRWTREQIADWVQTLEEQQAVEAERQQALESATSTYAVAVQAARSQAVTSRLGI